MISPASQPVQHLKSVLMIVGHHIRRIETEDTEMHPPTQSHNYILKAVAVLMEKRLPPRPHLLTIQHDAWCDLVNGHGFCNCNPTFKVRPAPDASDN